LIVPVPEITSAGGVCAGAGFLQQWQQLKAARAVSPININTKPFIRSSFVVSG
jgi:hypothetical protein